MNSGAKSGDLYVGVLRPDPFWRSVENIIGYQGTDRAQANIRMAYAQGPFLRLAFRSLVEPQPARQTPAVQRIDNRRTIDAGVESTFARLYEPANGSHELMSKAHGVLRFP